MTTRAADTRQASGEAQAERAVSRSPRGPFGPTLVLTVAICFALFAIVTALAHSLIEPTYLPSASALPLQNQDSETLVFLLSFAVILPLVLVAVPRVAEGIAAGPNRGGLSALAGILAAGLLVLVLLVRLSEPLPWGDGLVPVLVAAAIWCVAAALALARAGSRRPWLLLERVAGHTTAIWALAGALLAGAVLAVTDLGSIALLPLALGAAAAAAVLVLYARGAAIPQLDRRWGRLIDATAMALLLLAVVNLVIFRPEEVGGSPGAAWDTSVIQWHQNFFLGPANHVLAGDALLVDTVSQYGVGSIYLIAGWFQFVPTGNGTLGFLDGFLHALVFVAGYLVLRLSGVSRAVSITAMAIAVIALVFALRFPVGALLQHGGIRFGLPMALILVSVAGSRSLLSARATRIVQLALVALASIWALEAFAYTLLTLAAILGFEAWTLPAAERARWLGRRLAQVVAVCVGAHLLFAGATLLAAGQLPEWGQYLGFLSEFLFGEVGIYTFDFSPWAPGVAVAALYLASAAAVVILLRQRREVALREPTKLVALCGTTAYGIALMSYFVNRSADHILPYVSLPAVLLAALWLTLLLRSPRATPRRVRLAGLGSALALGVLLVAVAWSSVGTRFSESALAHLPPGGKSVRFALERLWDPPPLKRGAPVGERLLDNYMPGEDHSRVLTGADLGVEILVRSGRANEFPLSDPWEDSFVPDERLPDLERSVSELRPGDLLLIDEASLSAFEAFRDDPSLEPSLDPVGSDETAGIALGVLAPLQLWLLDQIGERFDLERVGGEERLQVVRLVPRASAGAPS